MELLLLGYLVLELTGSVFQVGLISVFLNGPRPPLALVAGMLADRLDRWRILATIHTIYLLLAACLLVLLILGLIEPWHVYAVVLAQGTAKVLDDPTRRASLFDLAGQDRIAHAMSLETMTNNGGKMLGPFVGGVLLQFYGFTAAFAVLVALDVASAALVWRMRLPERSTRVVRDTAFWSGIGSAVRHSFSNKFALGVLTISLVMNGMVLPVQYFIPVIATDVLKVGPALGGLLGAADGIGAFVGAIIIAVKRSYSFHGRYYVFGATIVAVCVATVSWSPWFLVSFLVLFTAGVGQAGFSTMQSTILMLSTAPEMRGRIMGSQGLVNGLGHLVGGFEIAALAQAFTISLAMGLNAGVGLLLIAPVMLLTPLIKRPVEPHREESEPARPVSSKR